MRNYLNKSVAIVNKSALWNKMPPKKKGKGKGKKGKKGGKGDKDDGATEGGKVGTPEPSEKELLLQQEYVCKLTISFELSLVYI